MMGTPKNYLLVSSVASLFSSAAVIDVGIGFQVWYAVMAVNFLLFAWLGAVRFRPGMWLLAAALLASGAVGWLQHTDTLTLFAKQFAGILASAFYFSCYYRLTGDDPIPPFRLYVRAAYYVSIAGIVIIFVRVPFDNELPRLQSVLSEPSMFALVTLPAAYYCLDRYRQERTCGRELAVIGAALLLSRSSVGYLGLLFLLTLFFARSWSRALTGLAVVAATGASLYAASADFRIRLDDTLRAAGEGTVEDANLSTFALVSNALVTVRVLSLHPWAGNGLGSHLLSHNAYIGDVPGVAAFENMILRGQTTMEQLNAADANSLLLRLLSETGIAGVLAAGLFIRRYKAPHSGERAAINHAILIYFFAKLLRAGHYFPPEEFFFVFAYCLTGSRALVSRRPRRVVAAPLEASI
jgi:hypothetical protein